MSPARWRELEPHFDALLDLDAGARGAYLARLPAADSAELGRLFAERGPEDAWRALPDRAPDLLLDGGDPADDEPDLADRAIGPYRIVRALGRGGMSVVYLARRDDGRFEQEVAVKVMHWTGGASTMRRFQREQQTLARLDHPAITRIFDSGVTDDGLPYFVMERVEGRPITIFCGERRLSTAARVRLCIEVCNAVHSAHRNLVVHRDLKPDNVLVTGDGHVKVLDFGIAKWLEDDEGGRSVRLTRQGEGLLTPQYAAPEQFLEQPATTATDVYGLGLLLYEMLAGTPPYELSGKSITEQQRLVCERDPAPLSSRIADPRLRHELRGDLELICARALQKDPARRYASAAGLADDLRRHLAGDPVEAAPDSAGYRAAKFVRRHRVPVAIGAVAAAALLAGAIGTAWQARVAARERDHARIEAARAQQVVDFLVGAIGEANPYSESGGDVTVRQLLETSLARVDVELADQPGVRARVYTTMANVLSHAGDLERGGRLADRAVALADSLFGPRSVESAAARYNQARVLAHRDPAAAQAVRRHAIAALEGQDDHEARAMLANLLEDDAMGLEQQSETDSAVALLRRTLRIRRTLYPDGPHSDLARSQHHLASVLSSRHDPEAGVHFARAAALWRQTVGDHHPNYASTLNNWAIWLEGTGRPDSAEVLYRKALAIDRVTLGGDSRPLAMRLNNLGRLALNRGRVAAGESSLTEAVGILRHLEGSDMPLAAALLNLGLAAFLEGDYAIAEARYREGRAKFVELFGGEHPYVAVADAYLGRTLWKAGRKAEAEHRLRRAVAAFEGRMPAMAARLVAAQTWLGQLLAESDPQAGEQLLREAVAWGRAQLPATSPERGEAEAALGIRLVEQGEKAEGVPCLRAGYEILREAHGDTHPVTRWAGEALRTEATSS